MLSTPFAPTAVRVGLTLERVTLQWSEWGNVTRFLESARVAFARERNLWQSLEIADRESVTITTTTGSRRYDVPLSRHLAAVHDETTLYVSALIHYYAIAEDAACRTIGVDQRKAGGIEQWGARLLEQNSKNWGDVEDGLPGAVEVAVVRNSLIHGGRVLDELGARRLTMAGALARTAGQTVTLGYDELVCFRTRLRHLLMAGGLGS